MDIACEIRVNLFNRSMKIRGFRELYDRGKAFTGVRTAAAALRRTRVLARTDGMDSTATRPFAGERHRQHDEQSNDGGGVRGI